MDALYNLSVTYENLGRFAEAARAFERYVDEFHEEPDLLIRAARDLERAGMHDDAVRLLLRFLVDRIGRAPEAYAELARLYRVQGDETSARSALETCSEGRGPVAAACAFEIAESLSRAPDVALAQVEKAYLDVAGYYDDAPMSVAAYTRLGEILERAGPEGEVRAIEAFAIARSRATNGSWKDRAEDGLRRLRPDETLPPRPPKFAFTPAWSNGFDAGDARSPPPEPPRRNTRVRFGAEGCREE